jgi:SAM-dependent methyltransferase
VNFWRWWLTTSDPSITSQLAARIAVKPMDSGLIEPILSSAGPIIRVLDVGAGPLTPLSPYWPGKTVILIPVDALAPDYDLLLHEAGIVPPVRTLPMHGERLTQAFPPDYFDAVNCGNALDHFYDPARAVREMLGVTRPGGIVRIVTHENEGERQGYEGLHQWNICSDRIWNSEGVSVPWSEFPAQVSWRLNSYDPPMLEVILQRDLMPSS